LEAELKKLEALQKQQTELREGQVVAGTGAIRPPRHQRPAQRISAGNAARQSFVRIELIPYSRDAQGIERSLREVLGAAGKYVDDLYQEQEGHPKGLVADLLGTVDLVEQPGVWDTAAFEQALLTQKKRLSQACRGQAEFGGWFNKFLKAEADKRRSSSITSCAGSRKTACRWNTAAKEMAGTFSPSARLLPGSARRPCWPSCWRTGTSHWCSTSQKMTWITT
jgi:hypothetical protein